MNPTFVEPTIDIIKTYAMHGIIHGRRACVFCNTQMRLIKTDRDEIGYYWVCPNCFSACNVVESSPLQGIRLRVFDMCVKLFERGYHPIGGMKLLGDQTCRGVYFILIRKAYGLYMRKKILPYMQLPGPVEIDETLISRKRWSPFGKMPKLKWAFGLFCRQTKIPLIFYVRKKTHWCLINVVKSFVPAGATVLSDCHSAYVNMGKSTSHLGRYGWYHFWINHSDFYVHEKYPFVQTSRIENTWRMMKQSFSNIKANQNPDRIDDILQTYCLRQLIKYHKTYSFTLRRLHDYWHYHMQRFLNKQAEGDMHPPTLFRIDSINEIVKERGYLWLPTQDPGEVLAKIEGFWVMSLVGDFLDIKRAENEDDEEGHLHPSLITLGKDPFKGV